jgi:short-subunit dehydrogenase
MNLLILGANSDMGLALAAKFAQAERADLWLASRDLERLEKKCRDLEIRFQVKARPLYFDALDYASHREFYQRLEPKPDLALLTFGHLGEQLEAQKDFSEARKIMDTNLLAAVSILEVVAADFETRGRGTIIALSSVAGERGRQSNYLYGAAKGGLTVYLSGLRARLFKQQVRVLTVLPGFVRTKMTESLELPGILTAEPAEVAEDVYKAYKQGKDVVYSKWFWRYIMQVIRLIPETIFKRLKL